VPSSGARAKRLDGDRPVWPGEAAQVIWIGSENHAAAGLDGNRDGMSIG
jgi:hypothetical protein